MAARGNQTEFGSRVRALRLDRKISLRRFAVQMGMSATYLSKIERGEFPPPGEAKIKALAEALGQDTDEFLALAGRIDSELTQYIRERPREMALFLRAAKAENISAERLQRIAEEVKGDT
jgi:transcriptional regulator with XRE-family HTH domain